MADIVEYCADRLPALLRLLGESDVELLELQEGDTRLRVHRVRGTREIALEAAEALPAGPVEQGGEHIRSPLVGTFYRANRPGMDPLAAEGTQVEPGSVVGYVEVLGESMEVPAGCRGVIVEVLATDGDAVEYGSGLFRVQPHG